MIIDRTAKIVPTRYTSRALRHQMGRQIGAADHDELLAAWLWNTEGWLLRQTYDCLNEALDEVDREVEDAGRRLQADWTDVTDLTPREVRQATMRSLGKLIAALKAERSVAARDGLSVNRTQGGPGDLGVDVTAVTRGKRMVVFQAKHISTSRTIGTPDLQRFNGTARPHHQADIAVMITNGT